MHFHITDLPSHFSHSINREGGREGGHHYCTNLVRLTRWDGEILGIFKHKTGSPSLRCLLPGKIP